MVRWLPRAASDAPSGSHHRVSRARRGRGHPVARARLAHTSRRPRRARTRHRAHSAQPFHGHAQARDKHNSAHHASLTPPTAAPLGAQGRLGTPGASARSTRRIGGRQEASEHPNLMLLGALLEPCNLLAEAAAGMGCRAARRAMAFWCIDGCGRRRAGRELAREPRASARQQRALHGMLACVLLSVCVFTGARHVRADAEFREPRPSQGPGDRERMAKA